MAMTIKREKFKKIIDIKSGYTWGKEQEANSFVKDSIRVLTVSNIQKELDLYSELYLLKVSGKDKKEKLVTKNWTIAVSSNGNRNRIGNCIFIGEDTEFLFASFLIAFKPKDNSSLNPKYFFYWLSSNNIQKRITSVSEGTTGLGNLDLRYLKNVDIEFSENPSEQEAILAVLSAVDNSIQATKETIKKAERLKKALMQNLLTGKLKPNGTWRMEDEFYIDKKFGKVPKGWGGHKVKSVIKLKNGKANVTSNLKNNPDHIFRFPVFGGNGITGFFDQYSLSKETLIIGRVGEYCGSVFKTPGFCWVTDNALFIEKFLMKFDIDFMYYILLDKKLNHYSDSTGQPKITQSGIGNLLLILHENIKEQMEISSKLLTIDSILEQKQIKIQKLERLKKSLMQNLLTGKVRIKNLPLSQLGKDKVRASC